MMTGYEAPTYLAFGYAAFAIFLFIRNEIVYCARIKAMALLFSPSVPEPQRWKNFDRFHTYGNYIQQILDIRKWSFAQFYPGIK